jgi:hypothetical protein
MSENNSLPPDLDARILAEAVMGEREHVLILRLAPRGSAAEHAAIGARIDALVVAGLIEDWGAQNGDSRFLVARAEAFAGGVAA